VNTGLIVNGKREDGVVWVPESVAVCPECRGRLALNVDEWESETGRPTEGGVTIDCEREPDLDDHSPEAKDAEHRWWQGEWMPVVDRVTAWAQRNVRVPR
jgi:hypothetical protein